MRRRKPLRCFLVLALAVGLGLLASMGCARTQSPPAVQAEPQAEPSPDTVRLEVRESELEGRSVRWLYLPQVSRVFAGNRNGELLAVLWREGGTPKRPEELPAIYVLNPATGEAKKVADLGPGLRILTAAMDESWVAWVEQSETEWRILALNRSTSTTREIDWGRYLKGVGSDFPALGLDSGSLVYNILVQSAEGMTSRVILKVLPDKETRTLGQVTGDRQYLGAPSISGDHVVWHRGEWTANMAAEVYEYDLSSGQSRRLSGDDPSITPVIWGRYVVWSTYDAKSPETKNISLYDLQTGSLKYLTQAAPEDHTEFWAPTSKRRRVICLVQGLPGSR